MRQADSAHSDSPHPNPSKPATQDVASRHAISWGSWTIIALGLVAAACIVTGKAPALGRPVWGRPLPHDEPSARSSRTDRDSALVFAGGIVEGPQRELPLQFEVVGRLKAVHVRVGQTVKADEPLAELDCQLPEQLVREAQCRLDMTRKQVRAGSAATGQPRGDEDANDQITLAESALQREQLLLEKCTLRAPRDGVVLEVLGQVGELVGPTAATPFATFTDAGARRVRAFVEELDAMNVEPEQAATIAVAGQRDGTYRGRVIECSPYVRPKLHRHLHPGERLDVRVREVIMQLEEDAAGLLIGLPVEVYIQAN